MPDETSKPKEIGARIVQLRSALDWPTAIAFASFIDISPQQLSNYEKGRFRPDIDAALKLCRKTGITLDWLYRGDISGLSVKMAKTLESNDAPGAQTAS